MNLYTYTFRISYKYSRDGKSWLSSSTSVKAMSEEGAIIQIYSKYNHVKDIKIMSVK